MTREEVNEILHPGEEASITVSQWLASVEVEQIQDDVQWISFQTAVNKANYLLDTRFMWYRSIHPVTGKPIEKLRTLSYSVPENIAAYIDLVQPTTRFGETAQHYTG